MNELLMNLGILYGGITIIDASIKCLEMNKIYNEAKKSVSKLKYRKGLMQTSKEDLKFIKSVHIGAMIDTCKYSFVPGYCFETTRRIFENKKDVLDSYIKLINNVYEKINDGEETERTYVAEFLAVIYSEYKDYLPDTYMGHKLEDATIRISRDEMIKFLKRNKILLTKLYDYDDGYIDYNVRLIKK